MCRVGIAGGRSQQGGIACGQHVQCGGAGRGSVALTGIRESSPSIPPLQLPRSCMESLPGCALWSKLWTRFERLAEIPK